MKTALASWWRRSRGQAAVLLLWLLPLGALLVGAVGDVGLALWEREQLRQACDLAALAAAQDVDLERLARAERWIVPEDAERDARRYVALNLAGARLPAYSVEVRVLNASASHPLSHPWTGRRLVDPTVAVRVEGDMPTVFLRSLRPAIHLRATADASVLAHP